MTEKQEIERLKKKVEPYLNVVNTLFKDNQINPFESALYSLTKNDPRSTILQCELILKQLLKENDSKIEDKLTLVQIKYILNASHNFKSIDFETAVFTFCNLIQILETYYPDIKTKITTDNDIDYIREKLEPHLEYVDKLFQDSSPLKDALDFSRKDSKKFKLCVGSTRVILERLLPMIYYKTFGKEAEKKGVSDIVFNEQFRLRHKQHHHTLDVIREVGNWGHHFKEFPITEKHALFSLHSLYIILKWFFNLKSSPDKSKTIKKIISMGSILFVATIIIIWLVTNNIIPCFCQNGYIDLLKEMNYGEAIQKIEKIKDPSMKDKFWLQYCFIKTGEAKLKAIKNERKILRKKIEDLYHEKYLNLYDLLYIIVYWKSFQQETAKNFYEQYKRECRKRLFCNAELYKGLKVQSIQEISNNVLNLSIQNEDPFQFFDVIKKGINDE